MKSFDELLKHDELKEYITEQGHQVPTAVQEKTFADMFAGKSMSVLAKTGTGKTLAYALPLIQKLKETEKDLTLIKGSPRAVILLPTKELASQVFKIFKEISHFSKLRIRLLKGGDSAKRTKDLSLECFDVLISGPGRVAKGLGSKELNATCIKHLILDEADTLLDMGFIKDIQNIWNRLEWEGTQVALFSATLPVDFDEFKSKVFKNIEFIDLLVDAKSNMKQSIETFNINLGYKEKYEMFETFVDKEVNGSGIVFLNQKGPASELFDKAVKKYPSRRFYLLHGGMEASERNASFERFIDKGGILICTDIAARGIDIKSLNWVLNYDLPFEPVFYIHRSGRVGRGGRTGIVYNFVTSKDFELIAKINDAISNQSLLKLTTINVNKPKKKVVKKSSQVELAPKKVVKKRVQIKRKKTPRYKKN